MSLSRVSHLVLVLGELGTEELVVDPVPASQCQVLPMVAPSMPETTLKKKVTAKGKGPIHWMTRPCACKVTWVPSPSPGVSEVPRPDLPVTGPSAMPWPPLFEDSILSGGGNVGPDVPVPPGEYFQATSPGCD